MRSRAYPISRRELFLSILPASAFLRAQDTAVQADPKFSTDVKVVNVFATVHNKQGQIVRDLTKDDFTLTEEGRPQTIRYFSRETDLPLTLGLLVDTSGSQRRVLGAEQTACYRFLDQVLREDKDMAFVLHFEREVELLQDLTSSKKQLKASLALLEAPAQQSPRQRGGGAGGGGGWPGGGGGGGRYPGSGQGRQRGGTSLYDAVLLGSDELMRKQVGRKAHILLTDGVDNASKVSLTDSIESAQRADTLVYSILFADQQGYGGAPMGGGMGRRGGMGGGRFPQTMNHPDGKKVLQRLSKETGGSFFEVTQKQPIEVIFDHIQEELRNQYSLGYTPDQAGSPGYRKIALATKDKSLIVQTRDGYYGHDGGRPASSAKPPAPKDPSP
jgi:VWFA-related protein